MNKKYFKEAVDEIKVDKKTKVETLNKITNAKRHYKIKYIVGVATMVLVIAITAFINPNLYRTKTANQIVVETLPTVGNFENLYNILKETEATNNSYYKNEIAIMDSTVATAEESKLSEDSLYSETNVQVKGVDESDIVKTDGEFIYYVNNSKVVIVNAKDSKNLQIENEIVYEKEEENTFYPEEIYLKDNKLIVIGTKYYKNQEQKYSYFYEPCFLVAKVYNIKNKKAISLEREIEIEGNYLSSRMIDNNVYLIANQMINVYNLKDKEITEINEEELQVKYKDTAINNETCKLAYDSMYYIPKSECTSYINIASFNIEETEKEADIKSYMGAGDNVYCSKNNLYITNTLYEYKNYGFYHSQKMQTAINKFELKGENVRFVKQGIVNGKPLNQFSMDESDGYFRIATTDNNTFNSENNVNNLYVLDDNLNIVGKLENLAKGERIYSVRFIGKRAYIVTFVQTDPLFVIDLSKPAEPTVLGELKIPGFSNYLHPYDETHIIGFGQDTEVIQREYGEQVKTTGMKMALFDVSDPNNPKEMYVEKIGEEGTYSELLNNHKALLFSKEKNIIAFPITVRDNNYKYKFQGAVVYGLTLDNGFTLKGQITHKASQNSTFKYDESKEVERIIYINNQLFTLSKGLIKSIDMETMEELSSVEIEVLEGRHYYLID